MSNMVFWRVLGFACDVGRAEALDDRQREWVAKLACLESQATYSPDLCAEEPFDSADEVRWWSGILWKLAELVYRREIGNQDNQTWQVPTIAAACSLSTLLDQWEWPGKRSSRA